MIGPQALHAFEKLENFNLDKARSLRSTSLGGGRHSPVKKRERNLNFEKLSKISITQTVFLLQFLNIGKLFVFKRKKKETNCKGSVSSIVKFIEWTLLHASVQRLRHFYSSKRIRKKKRERRKRTVERHFCLMLSCWLNIAGILKREKKKELFLKSHHYLFNHHLFRFRCILNVPLCWNLLVVCFLLSIWLLLHVSCLILVPLSLILATHLIASLNITREFWKSVYS